MTTSPGYLTGAFTAAIIATMHTRGEAGPWDVIKIDQHGGLREITFAVGSIYAETVGDPRQRVLVTVEEVL